MNDFKKIVREVQDMRMIIIIEMCFSKKIEENNFSLLVWLLGKLYTNDC